jgi:hypothetical protein
MELSIDKAHVVKVAKTATTAGGPSNETPKMKKSTKCAALLVSLFLVSAAVNSIFIVTAGGRAQPSQQAHRNGSAAQKTAVADCAPKATDCAITTR